MHFIDKDIFPVGDWLVQTDRFVLTEAVRNPPINFNILSAGNTVKCNPRTAFVQHNTLRPHRTLHEYREADQNFTIEPVPAPSIEYLSTATEQPAFLGEAAATESGAKIISLYPAEELPIANRF